MKKIFLCLIVSLLMINCNSDNEITINKPLAINNITNVKLVSFNKINELRDNLSQNGIGSLGQWKYLKDIGWVSLTNYFSIGAGSSVTGIANNFAYCLDSDNENYIKTLRLVLNINNEKEREQAANKFDELVDLTCKNVGIKVPKGLKDATKNLRALTFDTTTYFVKLELQKTKIETWTITIGTK